MPRPRKDVKKSKDEINRDHYKVMLEDKTYSEYLKEKKQQKQLKLTLSIEMDSAIRQYCSTQEDLTPQAYILKLIEDDLQKRGAINGENTDPTKD